MLYHYSPESRRTPLSQCLNLFVVGPLLYQPDVTNMMNSPRPSPSFTSLLHIILNANWRTINRVGLDVDKWMSSEHTTTIACVCHAYQLCILNWVLISFWDNHLPGSSLTATDLCGDYCRGRPWLLSATSKTAEPDVSVLIITLLTIIYCQFCWCRSHGEVNWRSLQTFFHYNLQYAKYTLKCHFRFF